MHTLHRTVLTDVAICAIDREDCIHSRDSHKLDSTHSLLMTQFSYSQLTMTSRHVYSYISPSTAMCCRKPLRSPHHIIIKSHFSLALSPRTAAPAAASPLAQA
jgi:hypothetical protein